MNLTLAVWLTQHCIRLPTLAHAAGSMVGIGRNDTSEGVPRIAMLYVLGHVAHS